MLHVIMDSSSPSQRRPTKRRRLKEAECAGATKRRGRRPAKLCDDTSTSNLQVANKTVIIPSATNRPQLLPALASVALVAGVLVLSSCWLPCYTRAEPAGGASGGVGSGNANNEYQLVGQAGDEVQLPCLIGRQLYCGDPYFIAWYKLNASSRSWVRIEYKQQQSDEELSAAGLSSAVNGGQAALAGASLSERARFTWSRPSSGGPQRLAARAACEPSLSLPAALTAAPGQVPLASSHSRAVNFDCAQLSISSLELSDEGQYKCEITFSESLDFDKCPATTLSQLNVIARPNEPELLVNGRAPGRGAQLTFKEGAQVKLECQSSGGRPAPRIEWLNVSDAALSTTTTMPTTTINTAAAADHQLVQLMRAHWPMKKASFLEAPGASNGGGQPTPVTSISVTISLSRFDLQSQFVCLVVPQPLLLHYAGSGGGHSSSSLSASAAAAASAHEQLIKNPAYLKALLNQRASVAADAESSSGRNGPMLKWIKLDVQVKPSTVSIVVRDVQANSVLQPVERVWPLASVGRSQPSAPTIGSEHPAQAPASFYSLQLNRLYAVQCLVEDSRPRSQVAWFNRTVPVGLGPVELNASDYLVPNEPGELKRHRLSSFTRSLGHANGTFRTTATLLLTTNIWDSFEEIFCRVSNEAFQFDELIQVAPIVSARLYVNYGPIAWLEADGAQWPATESAANYDEQRHNSATVGRLTVDLTSRLALRCTVAANPLSQNTILQIEWLKDGRKLTVGAPGRPTNTAGNSGGGATAAASAGQRVHVEKANHLHMPPAPTPSGVADSLSVGGSVSSSSSASSRQHKSMLLGSQLGAGNKLVASSSLTIEAPLLKSDAGAYSCQYKLIPAPSAQSFAGQQQQQQQQIKITSGQANQTIQVNVIEAKPKPPTLRILSSAGLLVYGLLQSPSDGLGGKQTATVVVTDHSAALISLKCDLAAAASAPGAELTSAGGRGAAGLGYKIMWYLNGAFLHSSSSSDVYNFTLSSVLPPPPSLSSPTHLGSFTCAHHVLGASASSGPDNFHGSLMRVYQSANELDLKVKVGPRLLERRDLMPRVRSFSELELSANSASKLRLVCLAQCEPICAIDWYLNGQPVGRQLQRPTLSSSVGSDDGGGSSSSAASIGDDDDDEESTESGNRPQSPLLALANATSRLYTRTYEAPFRLDGGLSASLVSAENLVHRQNEPKFTWLKQVSLSVQQVVVDSSSSSSSSGATGSSSSTLLNYHPNYYHYNTTSAAASRQLMREASELQAQLGANVFSKFELTYNQIGQLLAAQSSSSSSMTSAVDDAFTEAGALVVKCKLNTLLDGGNGGPAELNGRRAAFGYAFIEPGRWFPERDVLTTGASNNNNDAGGHQFAMSNEPLNLTAPNDNNSGGAGSSSGSGSKTPASSEIDNESRVQLQTPWNDLHSRRMLSLGGQATSGKPEAAAGRAAASGSSSFADEMQISILLDRPPKSASISFAGTLSTHEQPNGVTLTEGQLLELADPNRAAPMLQCKAAGAPPYPPVQFKWTFTDLNHTEHSLATDGPQLNLRQFVEFHQRRLNVDPMSAFGVDVIAGIVGNYSCQVSNIHGSKSASLSLSIQGRPLCKLTLGNEYLGENNELMANLRCSIYSMPLLLETVWFRNNQQLSVNKTTLDMLALGKSLSSVELPVTVLNKQQDFMLADLVTQMANFKCVARNPLGYSEACELGQLDKQTLLNPFKQNGGLAGARTPALSMLSLADSSTKPGGHSAGGGGGAVPVNFLSNSSVELASSVGGGGQPVGSLVRNLFARPDWILMLGCSVAFGWLLIVAGSAFIRRRSSGATGNKLTARANHDTSWRFNQVNGHGVGSNNEIVGVPFQSKICVNYYGDSNGDSEHDMIQSCSQSSNYEDFAQHQLQLQQQQQQQRSLTSHHQPVYFNSNHHSTLNRRPLKSSMSASGSSTGDSSTGSRQGQQQQQLANNRYIETTTTKTKPRVGGTMRDFVGSTIQHPYHQTTTTTKMQREPAADKSRHSTGITLASNVPLINETHNSRINLDQQQHYHRPNIRDQQPQQTFSSQLRNEPIYDDVIYNQMVL